MPNCSCEPGLEEDRFSSHLIQKTSQQNEVILDHGGSAP